MGDHNDRCPDCDAPLATEDLHDAHPDGCQCAECSSVCWREWYGDRCLRVAMGVAKQVDWRAEALALRERVDSISAALEKEVGESHLCDEWDHGYLRGIGRAIDIVKGAARG